MAVRIKKGSSLDVLNMTPLIDVVFQLLLFFLVATRFAEEDREMDFPLPAASEAKPLIVQPEEMTVNIDRHGQYYFRGQALSASEVEQKLREAVTTNPTQSVIVRADKRVQLDYVVFVLNLCNKAGVFNYSITTEGSTGTSE